MADETQAGTLDAPITINIGNVCDGAMLEMFDLKLQEILANIYDLSTNPTVMRSLKLQLNLKPAPDRIQIDAELTCSTVLAPIASKTSRIFVARDKEGLLYPLAEDPRQLNIFAPPKPPAAPPVIQFASGTK